MCVCVSVVVCVWMSVAGLVLGARRWPGLGAPAGADARQCGETSRGGKGLQREPLAALTQDVHLSRSRLAGKVLCDKKLCLLVRFHLSLISEDLLVGEIVQTSLEKMSISELEKQGIFFCCYFVFFPI